MFITDPEFFVGDRVFVNAPEFFELHDCLATVVDMTKGERTGRWIYSLSLEDGPVEGFVTQLYGSELLAVS